MHFSISVTPSMQLDWLVEVTSFSRQSDLNDILFSNTVPNHPI